MYRIQYLLNKSGPPGLSSVVLFKTVKVLVEQFESFSSEGDTIGVSSLMRAPNGSFSVTGVRMGLFKGDSTLRVSLHGKYYIYISLYMQISTVKFNMKINYVKFDKIVYTMNTRLHPLL